METPTQDRVCEKQSHCARQTEGVVIRAEHRLNQQTDQKLE